MKKKKKDSASFSEVVVPVFTFGFCFLYFLSKQFGGYVAVLHFCFNQCSLIINEVVQTPFHLCMDLENTSRYRVSCLITDLLHQNTRISNNGNSRICTFKSLPTVSIHRIIEHKCNFIRIRKYPSCVVVKPTGKVDISI